MNNNLYVIRHCETSLNVERKISGGADVPIANYNIDVSCFNGNKNAIIVTSPLLRCIQTCNLIRREIFIQRIIQDVRLVERDMGKLDGMKKDHAINIYPKLFDANGKFCPYETPPHGESYEKFKRRLMNFNADLRRYLENNTVIVVSHNQTLKMLYCLINNLDIEKIWNDLNFRNGELMIINPEA